MSQIIRDITEIARCGAQYRADLLAPLGLKGCHASYLTEICAQPGISQDQLAKRICINKSNVARQAATLEYTAPQWMQEKCARYEQERANETARRLELVDSGGLDSDVGL